MAVSALKPLPVAPGTGLLHSGAPANQTLPTKLWRHPHAGERSRCSDRFTAPKLPPGHPLDYNGILLPDVCINSTGPHHVFVIGDWGGVLGGGSNTPRPADHRSMPWAARAFVEGADDCAQLSVARQMQARSAAAAPDYVLNVGDNFYWGGILVQCGGRMDQVTDLSGQWTWVFEAVYDAPGLAHKQWLGVLGNHDYGGFKFTYGWDQAIGYTWTKSPTSTGRWMTPALYWAAKVHYPDFTVDYFFVDSNVFDSYQPDTAQNHNMCSRLHNQEPATCGAQGPVSTDDCPGWFQRLWAAQLAWMEDSFNQSVADWQIVVTHFPPDHGVSYWAPLVQKYGIDLMVTGHRHQQEVHYLQATNAIRPTAYVVSGGGGGITSEGVPRADGRDDQYGFMDLTLSKGEILIEAISHGGILRSRTCVRRRARSGGWAAAEAPDPAVPPLCGVASPPAQVPATATTGAAASTSTNVHGLGFPTLAPTTTVTSTSSSSSTLTSMSVAVAGEVRTSSTTTTTTLGAEPASSSSNPMVPLEVSPTCPVTVRLVLLHLSYIRMREVAGVLDAAKLAVAEGLAVFAGHGQGAGTVAVAMAPLTFESTAVRATVSAVDCRTARSIRDRLALARPMAAVHLAWLLKGLPGAAAATVPPGSLAVRDIQVSQARRPWVAAARPRPAPPPARPAVLRPGDRRDSAARLPCGVAVSLSVRSVDPAALRADEGLSASFKAAVATGLAVEAANWVDPTTIVVSVEPGTRRGGCEADCVAVQATIGHPAFVSATWVLATFRRSGTIGGTIAKMVAGVARAHSALGGGGISVADLQVHPTSRCVDAASVVSAASAEPLEGGPRGDGFALPPSAPAIVLAVLSGALTLCIPCRAWRGARPGYAPLAAWDAPPGGDGGGAGPGGGRGGCGASA